MSMDVEKAHQRLQIWQFGLVCIFLVLLTRLAYWQLWKHDELATTADQQYQSLTKLQTQRGTIYDRTGSVLATNEERYTLFAEPHLFTQTADAMVAQLVPLVFQQEKLTPLQASDSAFLKAEEERIKTVLQDRFQQTSKRWVPIWFQLKREQKDKIAGLKIPGLGFDPQLFRTYPDASVSAHLLGFVGRDERGEEQGYFGVEGFYDLELRGRAGQVESQRTALGLPLLLAGSQELSAQPGRDLTLTIDKALQHKVEEKLLAGIEKYGAESGEVVIMNPHTGEILAMASYPNYDPNAFIQFAPPLYRTPSISDLYEPGSTMKILTVAAGIESGVITPETQCPNCDGPRIISGFPIRTWNEKYNANITMRDALAKSDNTAMVFIQEQVGKERFLQWLRTFGFADTTGVDLQGEAKYEFRQDKDWRAIDVATSSFGQGIATTSLNLVRAVSIIANGGRLVRPYVVKSVQENGEKHETQPDISEPILKPETTKTVTEMMVYTASQGDAKWTAKAKVPVAGKTGTAQIAENGKYLEEKTIASFVGFAPADNPQFVMLVKLRAPQTSTYGSETAAPLWFEILDLLL